MPIDRSSDLRTAIGLYEPGIKSTFRQMARQSQVGLDIGSHYGFYALAMIKQGVPRVYALEPEPRYVASLEETVKRNRLADRLHVLPVAVGAESDPDCSTVDDLVRDGLVEPPGLVKMDIEGAELNALLGMRNTLDRFHPRLLIEVHSRELEKECIGLLVTSAYRTETLDAPFLMGRLLPEGRPIELNRWLAAWPLT